MFIGSVASPCYWRQNFAAPSCLVVFEFQGTGIDLAVCVDVRRALIFIHVYIGAISFDDLTRIGLLYFDNLSVSCLGVSWPTGSSVSYECSV